VDRGLTVEVAWDTGKRLEAEGSLGAPLVPKRRIPEQTSIPERKTATQRRKTLMLPVDIPLCLSPIILSYKIGGKEIERRASFFA